MWTELHVHLDEDPPATWAAAAVVVVEGSAQEVTRRSLCF
jgi:hypothetical protein